MTVLKISLSIKMAKILSFVTLVLLVSSSCANKIKFLTSPVVPAVRGNANVKMDGNKNHTIEISLSNLAEPDRLNPPKKMYMVWMETDQGITKNIGQIMTENGTFSKSLKSNFKTVTSFTPVKIFITAENDANVQTPNWEVILTTSRF